MAKKSNPERKPKPCLPLQTFDIQPGASRLAVDVAMGEFPMASFATSSMLVLHTAGGDKLLPSLAVEMLTAAQVDGLTVSSEAAAVLEVRPCNPPPSIEKE